MKIKINGKEEMLQESMSISDLLKSRKIRVEMVSVELNDAIVHRGQFPTTSLKEGDRVEFLYYMGGGGKFEVQSSKFKDEMRALDDE